MQLEAAGKLGEQLPEELAQTLTGSRAPQHKLVAVHRLLDLPSETLNRTRGFACGGIDLACAEGGQLSACAPVRCR